MTVIIQSNTFQKEKRYNFSLPSLTQLSEINKGQISSFVPLNLIYFYIIRIDNVLQKREFKQTSKLNIIQCRGQCNNESQCKSTLNIVLLSMSWKTSHLNISYLHLFLSYIFKSLYVQQYQPMFLKSYINLPCESKVHCPPSF